ncbi:MAG: plastocyanin/azurin family copper-binding protein [Gemmatimonadales bacterium]
MRANVFALLFVVACSDTPTDPNDNDNTPPPSAASVTIGDNNYTPSRVDLVLGGTVTWTWAGFAAHTLTFDNPDIASASARTSGNTSRQFGAAGEYTYFCEIHGRGMSGRVVVVAP